MYVYPQNIQKYTSTNIKTSLNTAALAFDSIKNLGTDLNPATLAAYNTQLSGLTATQQKMALSTTNLTLAQQKQVLSYIAETAAAKSLTAQQIAELSIDQKQALIKAGLITQEQIETGVTLELSKAQLQKIITSDAISTKDKELILGAFGVTGANLTETSSWEVLGASIKKATAAMLKWLFLTPAGWATLAITAIAGTIVAYNKWGDTIENNRKKLEELKSEAQTISSDLQTFNSELQTTQQRISELESKGNLTFTEAEELENLRKQNNELQRSIDLLKLKEKENNKGKNKTFVKTMQKNVDVEDERVQTGRLNPDDTAETEMITEAELIERKFNTLDELQEKLRHASTETEKKAIQEQIDKITKYLSECNEQYIEDAEGIDYIQNPTNEDDRKVNEWLDYINDFQDKMAVAMDGENAKENAFNRLVDNWKFDELLNPLQKLGKEGKVTLDDLKSRMSDPVFAEFVNKLVEIGVISDTTDGSLRYLANAFNGTATSARNYVTALKGNDLDNFIKNLGEEAKALGTTESELAKLTAAHVIFNNTGLSTEQQQQALQMLAAKIATTSAEMKYLLQLFNYASGNFDAAGASTMTEQERRARTVRSKQYLKDKYGIDLSPIKIPEKEDVTPYTPSGGDKGSSSKNSALDNYLKDAENRYKIHQDETKYINDLNHALQNLVKTKDEELDVTDKINEAYRDLADNRIKDLEHQNELLLNQGKTEKDLITNYKEIQKIASEEANRLRALGYDDNSNEIQALQKTWWDAENNKLDFYSKQHENLIRDIEHARDMALEANPFTDTTSYYKQMQDAYRKEAERLRALDPEKYKDEIQALSMAWHDAQNAIADWSYTNSQNWITLRNTYNDWDKYGDNEAKAWKRVLDRFKKEFPTELDKIREIEENYYNAIKDEVNEILDLNKSRIESQKTLLQSYYDVSNSVAEAQHEINKELSASKTMYEYLDEDTRKLLFNQEDYNTLTEELYDIQYKADKLKRQYERDLENSTLNTIEEITSNYEMQYETLMKSYEIAKAELEVAKKRQQLDNVLNERNVRMFINGQWQWVANTQDVIDAQNELADAKFEAQQALVHKEQTESMNELTAATDKFTTIMNKIDSGAIDLRDGIGDITSSLKKVSTETVPALKDVIDSTKDALQSFSSSAYNSSSSDKIYSSSSGSYGSSYSSGRVLQVGSDGNAPKGATVGDVIKTAGGNYKIVSAGTSGATYNPSSGHWSIKVGTVSSGSSSSGGSKTHPVTANRNGINISTVYLKQKNAKGTGYTQSGSMLAGEDGEEIFIDNNGHLIPVLQPTIFKDIEAGGKVFNNAQMRNLESLWNLSNVGFNHSLPAMVERNQSVSNVDNSIHINGITISEQGNEDWISGLKRFTYTHGGRM